MDVIFVQETMLPPSASDPKIADFACYRQDRTLHRRRGGAAQGGLATYVRNGVKHEILPRPALLPATAALEIFGIRLFGGRRPVDCWNVYRPPTRGGEDARDGRLHTAAWPSSASTLICGDFNAHGSWDDHIDPDSFGDEIEEFCDRNGMSVLNDGHDTRLSPAGDRSPPDASICGPALLPHSTWTVLDSISSDHLPLCIDIEGGGSDRDRPPGRLNMRKCDWELFRSTADNFLSDWDPGHGSVDAANRAFADAVLNAARAAAPFGSRAAVKPWWTPACAAPSPQSRVAWDTAKEAESETYRSEKERTWREYVTTLDPRAPKSKIWGTLRAMDGGKSTSCPDRPLYSPSGRTAISDREKARIAVRHYTAASRISVSRRDSKEAYTTVRDHIRSNCEPQAGSAFSDQELAQALASGNGNCPGGDGVSPEMLRQLSPAGKTALLALLNRAWLECRIPASWRRAVIVPILKKAKSPAAIASFRPISLLSCIGKVSECMLKNRLQFWSEKHNIIPSHQGGFTPGRSTTDCIASIVQPAFEGLNEPKPPSRTLICAVDFKGAYDKVWRQGLLKRFARARLPSHWVRYMRSWLADRRCCVRWGAELSGYKVLQAGLPQGSSLSCLAYLWSVADLPTRVVAGSPSTRVTQYADDVTISCSSPKIEEAGRMLQGSLRELERWAAENYVTIAPEKTEAVVVSLDPSEGNAKPSTPALVLGNVAVAYGNPKILGVTIDSQLRFTSQAKAAAAKIGDRVKIMRALSGTSWGSSEASLRQIYLAFARPSGTTAIGAWYPFLAKTSQAYLDRAQYRAARIITGCPAASPSTAVEREAGLLPMHLFAESEAGKLLLAARRRAPGHALADLALPRPRRTRLKTKDGCRGCWRDWGEEALSCLPPGATIAPWPDLTNVPPPWTTTGQSLVRFHYAGAGTARSEPPERRLEAATNDLALLTRLHPPDIVVDSDGSAEEGARNGAGGVSITWHDGSPPTSASAPAGTLASSTTAEAVGAALGLRLVYDHLPANSPPLRIWLRFDSRALHDRLQRPWSSITDGPSRDTTASLSALTQRGHEVHIVWVPSHCGLPGNEAADAAANEGRAAPQAGVPINASAAKSCLKKSCEEKAKLHYLNSSPPTSTHRQASNDGRPPPSTGWSRKDSVTFHRLRVNRYEKLEETKARWGKVDSPTCRRCGLAPDSTTHFITECPALNNERVATIGASPSLACFDADPEATMQFVRQCARHLK